MLSIDCNRSIIGKFWSFIGCESIRYVKFDTFTPAASRGLPVTRVISRMTLQQILARAVGEEIIRNESNVVDFEDSGDKVMIDFYLKETIDLRKFSNVAVWVCWFRSLWCLRMVNAMKVICLWAPMAFGLKYVVIE